MSDLTALRHRVESAGQNPEDKQINGAIYAAADVIHATGGRFGEYGEEIPGVAKEVIEAFLVALETANSKGGSDE